LTDRDRSHRGLRVVTAVASIAVGILPIAVLETSFGVPRKLIVGYGILAWIGGAFLVKTPLHHYLVDRILRRRLSQRALATTQGIVSSLSELGVAAAFFVFVVPHLAFWQVIGFGVGAGAVEAVCMPFVGSLFKGTSLEEREASITRGAESQPIVQWLSVLERVWAMLIHIGCRGLVYLSVAGGRILPAAVGVTCFAAVDGVVYYGWLRRWRFEVPRVLWRVHAFLIVAALCALSAFVLSWEGVVGAG
jgi:hypothetical protein